MKDQTKEEFVVTARKWRPLRFGDVIGQQHITTTLLNAIRSNRIHHAYLFSGPRGIGKTTTARILARAVNCLEPMEGEPCNKCKSCEPILEGRSMDVIEIDGASNNSVDDIRKLRENAKYPPVTGKYKMYIIDEVHMLSTSAFNALLKTLEEPPPHLMFVFATTESHKVPATIISRCQRFDFRRMEIDNITGLLMHISKEEDIKIDDESLISIAKKADGSMRDAESLFDQVVAFCGRDIKYADMADALNLIDQDFFFRVSGAIAESNVKEMFAITREVISKGYDLQECLQGLLEHFRNLLTISVTGDTSLIESSAAFLEKYKAESDKFSQADILRIMNMTGASESSMRFAPQPRVKFEMTLIQLATMDKAIEISELIGEIRKLCSDGMASLPSSAPDSRDKYQQKQKAPEKKIPDRKVDTDEAPKTGTTEKKSVSPAEILDNWDSFVDKYSTGKSGITTLTQAVPKIEGQKLILYADQQFIAENLKQNCPQLNDMIVKHFGAELKVEVILNQDIAEESRPNTTDKGEPSSAEEDLPGEKEAVTDKDFTGNLSNKDIGSKSSDLSKNSPDGNAEELHPIEKTLIDLFGAKKVSSGNGS